MSRKYLQIGFSVLLLAGIMLGLANLDGNRATAQTIDASSKIESTLLDKFATESKVDFIVSFSEHADLSPAEKMDWDTRGHYVYDTLTSTAARVQANTIKAMAGFGLKTQTFYANNILYVYSGNLEAATAAASLPEVSDIRETRVYQLDPAVETKSILVTATWAGELLAAGAQTTVAVPDSLDWGIVDSKADQFWATYGFQGDGIVVANIDTGVDWTHEALVNNYKCASNPSDPSCWLDPGTQECSGVDGGPCDDWSPYFHGTHTMGTMVGDDDPSLQYNVGMAPNAQWIACRGCPSGGCPDFDLNSCADWIVAPGGNPDNRPDVVNNSWGGGGGNPWYQWAVQAWVEAGVFPAFSAGNSGSCSSLGSPGDYQESFGSAAHRSDRQIADFSSKGPSAVFGHDPYTKPNISAPGEDIMSAMPGGYQLMSGTSMASPHTAGAVALLWSCNPSLVGQIDATFQILQNNADPAPAGACGAPPDGQGNNTYGYGYLDVLQAGSLQCGDVGYVEGHVTNSATGAPIEGAEVTAVGALKSNVDAITDPDGFYHMGLLVNTYNVTASAFGFLPDTENGVVVVKDETDTVDFALVAAPSNVVDGTVTDGETGWPLYAKITIDGFPGDPIWTDPETGQYSIELPQGILYTFHVEAFVGGYLTADREVGPLTGDVTEDFGLVADPASCSAPGRHPDCFYYKNFEGTDGGFTTGGSTTFAWGIPTSGPGEAHSGDYVWATNPSGQYNNYEDGWVESPNIDLSSLAGQSVLFSWWQWLKTESCCDHASIDVSNDGGATWTTVYGPVQGDVDLEWTKYQVFLDQSYAVANFRVRFHFTSDLSITYDGWYIDDICFTPVPPPDLVLSEDFEANNGGFTPSGSVSWEWGVPTSGPGFAHSGVNVWATNLDGNYNNNEDSYVTSPAIDLSAYAGSSIFVNWWQWLQTESGYDNGELQLSKDGGSSWTTVYNATGNVDLSWTEHAVAVDSSFAVSNFMLRFYLHTDGSVTYPGYYVDDVSISAGAGGTVPCVAEPGGMVVGNVYDLNTGFGLVGASVLSDENMGFVSVATPDDPNVDDGFYTFFGTPGLHTVTASMDGYSPDSQDVTFIEGGTVRQDFNLGTGFLTWDPTSLSATLLLGGNSNATLTLGNTGNAPLTFEIRERDQGFEPAVHIPRFTGTIPVDNVPPSSGRAPATSVVNTGSTLSFPLAGEPAYAVDIYPGYNLVNIPDTTVPGSWNIVAPEPGNEFFGGDFINGDFSTLYVVDYGLNQLIAVDTTTGAQTVIGPSIPSGGQSWTGLTGGIDGVMYGSASVCGSSSTLYTVDLETGAATPVGTITNGTCIIDIAMNANGDLYGVDIVGDNLIQIDPATGAGTVVGSLGVGANYAQGMDFEEETGILYWAAYTTQGELRIIDTTTGASQLVGAFPGGDEVDAFAFTTGGNSDVPWLSETPITGTVPVGGEVIINVTFDASAVTELGDYFADLRISTDTPYDPAVIPVVMHVVEEMVAPVASFEADEVVVGNPTTFTNTSEPGVPAVEDYVWTFGDGSTFTSHDLNPVTHTYATFGTFEVTLEACNAAGCDTFTATVVVQPIRFFLPVINRK